MTNSPRLRASIAMATFQGGPYIGAQLESILSQTRVPDELCISDDGSTDETLEVIRDFASRAPFPVKVALHARRDGVNANFENAVRQCTGDVILFADQDDVWTAEHVAALMGPMEGDLRVTAVASDSRFVSENLEPTNITQAQSDRFPVSLREATNRCPHNQLELVIRQNLHSGHGMAFRRSLVPLLVPFTPTIMYDEWVLLLAATAGFITYAGEPLTLHRQHASQSFGSRKKGLAQWAAQSKTVSSRQETAEEQKWQEIIDRVREHRQLVGNFRAVEDLLQKKLDFVKRRAVNRHRALPSRLSLTSLELLLGRYHRLGRGLLTFARDVYGVRRR